MHDHECQWVWLKDGTEGYLPAYYNTREFADYMDMCKHVRERVASDARREAFCSYDDGE